MSAWDDHEWCSFCGCNPVYGPGLCSSCQADEDFLNCPFCHGTSCTQECEDEDYDPRAAAGETSGRETTP